VVFWALNAMVPVMLTSASEQEICAANVSSGCGSVEVKPNWSNCMLASYCPRGLPNSPQVRPSTETVTMRSVTNTTFLPGAAMSS